MKIGGKKANPPASDILGRVRVWCFLEVRQGKVCLPTCRHNTRVQVLIGS